MFNEVLKKFLDKQEIEISEEELLIKELKTIIYFALQSVGIKAIREIYQSDSMIDELLNETVITLIDKKEILLGKIGQDNPIKSYIKHTVKNSLIDKLRKRRLKLNELQEETENCRDYRYKDRLIELEACDFIEISKNSLTKAEKEAICSELTENVLLIKSKNSFDKAKNRAKNRLKQIIIDNKFSQDIVEFALKVLFVSKICKEFVNKMRG